MRKWLFSSCLMFLLAVGCGQSKKSGANALHAAVQAGHRERIAELVRTNNAQAFEVDAQGRTPLRAALEKGDRPVIEALLVKDAPVNSPDADGLLPLHYVMTQGMDPTLVKLLLTKKAGTQGLDKQRNTPLHVAVRSGRKEYLAAILEAKDTVPLRYHDAAGERPLDLALKLGHPELARLLIESDPAAWEHCLNGTNTAGVKQVLALAPAAAKQKDPKGTTPLHIAVRVGNAAAARVLLEQGADANARGGREGEPPLALTDKKEMVNLLADFKADLNAPNGNGYPPLLSYAMENKLEAAEALLVRGADPQRRSQDGYTALLCAVVNDKSEMAKLLLQRGADPRAALTNGATPLHLAVVNNAPGCVAALLEAKADPMAKQRDGFTPLHMLGMINNMQDAQVLAKAHRIVALLRKYGADPNAKDNAGRTPKDNAHAALKKDLL